MLWWLIGVVIAILVWASLWQRNFGLALGILFGVLLAWLLSYFLQPYVTGMEDIPVWLPPLPLATVALLLFVYGAVVWFRGNDALPQKKFDDDKHHH
ncbi:MAG: hypothetical protein R3305_03825 [Gammaproteobacteria bacterium]|nr:hypothetical protein [Gammaproteobacteria bacterium]